jgi:hypothetical protein
MVNKPLHVSVGLRPQRYGRRRFLDLPVAVRAATRPVTRFPFPDRFLAPGAGTLVIGQAHEEGP